MRSKHQKLASLRAHRYRMFYISPERLQIRAFRDELRATMQNTPIGTLVIDEAHCVSEWGHDFRPAYLQISRLRAELELASGRRIPVLALTATASVPVRQDILGTLDLPEDSAVQLASSDRPNLSLSVHPVPSPIAQPEQLESLIREIIPTVLHTPLTELIPVGEQRAFPHAGVVFGMYADSHGRHTMPDGVHYIAEELVHRNVVPDRRLVQVHASKAPRRCPECDSPRSRTRSGKEGGGYLCLNENCRAIFEVPSYPEDWNERILRRQDAFHNDRFPLLVATKGYGMGIDKQNIRYIIHHAFASGLEGYYQEAGRAGRDETHAHVALMYVPPHPECLANHIDSGRLEPPCVAEADNFRYWQCPFYGEHLCHYGLQARFIRESYPGVDKDIETTTGYFRIITAGNTFSIRGDDEIQQPAQLSLYRLQQLGIITDYTLAFGRSFDWITYRATLYPGWSRETVMAHLRDFYRRSRMSDDHIAEALAPLADPAIPIDGTHDHAANPEAFVTTAVRLLLQRIYAIIPRMRIDMLKNELRYVTSYEAVSAAGSPFGGSSMPTRNAHRAKPCPWSSIAVDSVTCAYLISASK